MSYNKKEIYNKTIDVINKNKLVFIEDIISLLPITKATFYDYFKINSDELNNIKELLDKNKVEIKVSLRSKWYKSENATLQLALYKIIGTDEEIARLNNSNHKIDMQSENKTEINIPLIKFIKND